MARERKIIQTIIPRIVIDPEKPNQIELLVNPDPKNPLLPNRLTEEQKVRFSKEWLAFLDEARNAFTTPSTERAQLFAIATHFRASGSLIDLRTK